MTTMYNSSDPGGGERIGEEGGNGGERAPPTSNHGITKALEDTANVLTAPDKVGQRDVNVHSTIEGGCWGGMPWLCE